MLKPRQLLHKRLYSNFTTEEYREKIRNNDRIVKAVTDDARIIVCNATHSLKVAQSNFNISNFGCRLLGRSFASCSMMAVGLKGDERVIFQWLAEGPLKKIYTECTRTGEIRGYLSNPAFEMTSSTPLGYAMRTGTFEVIHILYNNAKPYTSTVDMAGADVASDVEHYYKQVEGMPVIIDLETIFEGDNTIHFSGGLMIQPLPQTTIEATHEVIEKYRQRLKHLPPVRVLFKDDAQSLHEIIDTIAGYEVDVKHKSSTPLDFYCRCKREETRTLLAGFVARNKFALWDNDDDASELVETNCQFCNKPHNFTKDELRQTNSE